MNCLQATTRLCHSSPGHDFFTGFANPRVISSLSLTFCDHSNSLFLSRNSSSTGTNHIVPPAPAHNSSMEGAPSGTTEETLQKPDPVVQYIVLRKDLVDTMKWPLGSVISQGCHAAVAAIWIHKDDPVTAEYCGTANLDNMHKVTLEVKGETQLRNLAQKLEVGGVAHKLWMEQPENFPTCLATKPYRKSEVASFFKSLKLCR